MKTSLFASLTQARARRDHLAAAILGTLREIEPKNLDADECEEMIENICCAGKEWESDVGKIARILDDYDEEPPDVRILGKVVAWIRDEERRQLKEALATQ